MRYEKYFHLRSYSSARIFHLSYQLGDRNKHHAFPLPEALKRGKIISACFCSPASALGLPQDMGLPAAPSKAYAPPAHEDTSNSSALRYACPKQWHLHRSCLKAISSCTHTLFPFWCLLPASWVPFQAVGFPPAEVPLSAQRIGWH